MTLNVDDLELGMYLTILDHGEITTPCLHVTKGEVAPTLATIASPNKGGCGDVFKVMAIDLPFIVVVEVALGKKGQPEPSNPMEVLNQLFNLQSESPSEPSLSAVESRPVSLDTRQVNLKRLSAEYVNALVGIEIETSDPVDTSWMEDSFQGKDEEDDD